MKVDKIVLQIEKEKKVELTLDQARELKVILNDLFKDYEICPIYPYVPTYPWWEVKPSCDPGKPYINIICKS